MLQSKPREKTRSERDIGRVYTLVPELCYLTGLTEEMKGNFRIMKEVGSHTRLTPSQREAALHKFLQSVSESPDVSIIMPIVSETKH